MVKRPKTVEIIQDVFAAGGEWDTAKDNFKAEDSPAAQASALKLTPHPIPLSLSIRLLQVTVAISPPAAKVASKGNGFLRASDRKVPAGKCRISKQGREGSFSGETGSFSKRKVMRTPGRGCAVRFGAASCASCCEFLAAGVVLSFGGKVRL